MDFLMCVTLRIYFSIFQEKRSPKKPHRNIIPNITFKNNYVRGRSLQRLTIFLQFSTQNIFFSETTIIIMSLLGF